MPTYDAGTAAIRVRPSFKDFVNQAKAELKAMGLEASVRLDADTAAAQLEVQGFRAEAERQVNVTVDADVAAAETAVDGFKAEAGRTVEVKVDADVASAEAAVDEFKAEAERTVDVKVDADTAAAETETEAFRQTQQKRPVKVPVKGDLDAFQRDLIRQLDQITTNAQLKVPLSADGEKLRRDIQRTADEIRQALSKPIPDDAGIAANLRRSLQQSVVDFRTGIENDLRGLGSSLVAIEPKADTTKLKSDLSSLKSNLGEAASLTLKVTGVIGAAGAIADLLAIADAAGVASRAVGLIPAIGFAGLAGIGSAAVGFKGIPDVFKALKQQSDGASASAKKQRDSTFDVSEAQYRLKQSQDAAADSARNSLRSQQDLNEAYRDGSRSLRDMNDQLEDQKLATQDASLGVEEAAKRLQEIQNDPSADSITRRRALLTYQQNVQRLKEERNHTQDLAQDTAEANAAGVEGSKQVVDGKDKVTASAKAQAAAEHEVVAAAEQLRRAQEEATSASGGGNKLNDALAKLSPNAKDLVADIRSIGPAWTDVRKSGQDAITGHLGPDIQYLADQQLPNAKAGIVGINTAINSGLRGVLASLSSETNKLDFRKTLDNTTEGFANAARGAKPFTDGLTKLVTVGSDFLPQMGLSVEQMSIKFDNLIQRTAADGSLKRWIQSGIDSGRELLRITEHIGSSIASIFRAAGGDGETLRSIDEMTGHLAAFLKSAEGQSDMRRLFEGMRAEAAKLEPILRDVPELLGAVSSGFRTWGDIALPILHGIADLLAAHPGLVQAAILAYVGFKTIKPIIDGASTAVDALARSAGDAAGEAKGVGKLKIAASGLVGLLGSPWTIAFTAAGAVFAGFVSETGKGNDALARFKSQAEGALAADRDLQKALGASHGATDEGVLTAETNSVKQLRDAWAANARDIPTWRDKLKLAPAVYAAPFVGTGVFDTENTREDTDRASQAAQRALDSVGLANDQLAQKITGSKPDFDALIDRLSGMGDGGREAAHQLTVLRDEWSLDASAVSPVTKAIADLGDKNKDAAGSIDAATQALERQRKSGLTLEDAQVKVNEALAGFAANSDAASGAVIRADGSIDSTTAKGRELYALLNNQLGPAWEQVTTAAYRDAIQHGKTADEAKAAAQQMSTDIRDSALKQIESMGYTQQQAETLLQHYIPLSGNFNAVFTADTSQATTAIGQYETFLKGVIDKQGQLPVWMQLQTLGITGTQHTPGLSVQGNPNAAPPPSWYQYLETGPGHAAGGRLPSRGPGTERRDGILAVDAAGMPRARVDGGEWVVNSDSSTKYDRELRHINAGTFPKLPGYTDGGVIGQDPAQQQPAQQQPDKSAAAAALDQFAQSRAGQPYGGFEDCSGYISELANIAIGLPPGAGRMGTSTEGPWLGAHGFQSGAGGYGDFRVGWINDPSMPEGGHTAGTLPSGVNVESGGATNTVMYGGAAIGANSPMFTDHMYLPMISGGAQTSGVGGLATGTDANTQQVLYPQAPLPNRVPSKQLQKQQNQAAVDAANSERNRVYADPKSTPQDKQAADYKYLQAQNTLSEGNQGDDQDLLSLQGIFTRAAPILATGLLSAFGLENSVLSSNNPYNRALNGVVNYYGIPGLDGTGAGGGYAYAPKNLPSLVTTFTPQVPAGQTGADAQPGSSAATGVAGGVVDTVKQVVRDQGWDTGPEWNALDQLVSHESSWNPNAQNPASTAYGLFQFLDQTWATVGGSKTSDPALQATYGERYIQQRYGDPASAWAFWQNQSPHWYDDGGIANGVGFLAKNVLQPERVLSPRQTATFDSALPLLESINAAAWSTDRIQPHAFGQASAGAPSGGYTFSPVVNARVADVGDLVDRVAREGDKHAIGRMAALPV
ncbi:putative bacteriophage protein [Nocardia nova SH22a]|uniref:Putative bacteriophage protein n=1 Tax=Nocardia nova SH22a TaxID=1415166 RepID=W5TP09_9NOCA|nr:transglycosylase SLT domain-containing protein [Nocardia nova]AHH20859.1 putative bacteriophage protein [Nocardia nova SH22a]